MKPAFVLALSVILLGLAAAVTFAQEVDVTGSWTMTTTSPRGERTATLVFVQEGEQLTVTSRTERGEATGTGTISGSSIQWTIIRETPRGERTVTYRGTVDGDTMSGELERGGNPVPWKAARSE